jgi:sec-independent protein translocase protein TatB
MFDFGVGYTEMFVIAVVAIVVIGPKDLPRVLRAFGKTMAKVRGMAREFQSHLDGAIREAGFEDVKKDLQSLQNIGDIKGDVKQAPKPAAALPAKQPDTGNDFSKYFGEPTDTKPASDAA